MKKAFVFICLLGFSPFLYAQTVEQKVANEVCTCIGESVEKEEVEGKMQKCIPNILAKVLGEGSDEEKKQLSTVGGVQNIILKVRDLLAESCLAVRKKVLDNKMNSFYVPSSSDKANEYYAEGLEFLEKGLYDKAAKKFTKAIKKDDSFILAIDNLAVSYRKMEDYHKAIHYYKKSLSIYPEGEFALLNIAVAYSLLNDLENSLLYYQQLNSFYPAKPESYFGMARISILTGEYENALDNILVAHKMYVDEESEYAEDSQQLINVLYHKFNELNKSAVFLSKAEEHGIEISLNNR